MSTVHNVLNMAQQWQAATDYTLAELGIDVWVQKAVVQANKVLGLVALRVDHESAKVKGELADARKATDAAIRKAYDVLNALTVLQPSTELSALINVLRRHLHPTAALTAATVLTAVT